MSLERAQTPAKNGNLVNGRICNDGRLTCVAGHQAAGATRNHGAEESHDLIAQPAGRHRLNTKSDLLGRIDDVSTISNFVVSTFVGTIPYPYEFATSEIEVAAVLEVPLSNLMDKANRRDDVRLVNGKLNYAPAFAHDGHVIFGATAKILDQFLALLENAPYKEAPWLKNRLPQ